MTPSVLAAVAVGIRFGGIVALENAQISIRSGQIVGLIGRNGSGKSTLFNCITGFLVPTSGSVHLDAADLTGMAPNRIVMNGVARTFQTPRLDLSAQVFEAVYAGFYVKNRAGLLSCMFATAAARRERKRLEAQTSVLLQQLGLADVQHAEIGTLSMGKVRLVEVARSIAAGARFLLLDEPAAGLTPGEVAQLSQEIRAVASTGIGVLLVEHNFQMIEALCDRVTVLESGSVLFEGRAGDVRHDPAVIASYLGVAIGKKGRAAL